MPSSPGRTVRSIAMLLACCLFLAGCSTTRHVALSHAPFGPVVPGDKVEIVTVGGETITGTVEAESGGVPTQGGSAPNQGSNALSQGGDALTVGGQRIASADMASLQVRKSDAARTGGTVGGAFAGMTLGPLLIAGLIVLLVPSAVIAAAM